jgi:hypothetical protein
VFGNFSCYGQGFPDFLNLRYPVRMELVFNVREAQEGGYTAQAVGHSIFTEADSWEQLRANALEAATLHFEDQAERPRLITLHFVKDESIAVEAA